MLNPFDTRALMPKVFYDAPADKGGGAPNQEGSDSETDGDSQNNQDALGDVETRLADIQASLEKFSVFSEAFEGWKKKVNDELARNRRSLKELATTSNPTSEGGDENDEADNGEEQSQEFMRIQAELDKQKADNLRIRLEHAVEAQARTLSFAYPEDAIRFLSPDDVTPEKILSKDGTFKEDVIETALKSTAEKYPALLKGAKPPALDGKRRDGSGEGETPEAANAKMKDIEQRFGIQRTNLRQP